MKIVIPEKILPESLDQPTLDQGESNASQAGSWSGQSITIDQPTFIWTDMKFGLPSTIRTCDLRLRRIRGC